MSSERRVIIRTVGLKKQYVMKGVTTDALRGVDVEIYDAEFISVMGPSGSGKSTFFNMIGALDRPTTGRVFIDEVDVAQLTAEELAYVRCHKIGYIFQSYNLVQYMTALGYWGVDWDRCIERFEQLHAVAPSYKDVFSRLYQAHVSYADAWYAQGEMCPAEVQYTQAAQLMSDPDIERKRAESAQVCLVATPTPIAPKW